MTCLSLSRALQERRLDEFVAHEEARGIAADRAAFDGVIKAAVKPPGSNPRWMKSGGHVIA